MIFLFLFKLCEIASIGAQTTTITMRNTIGSWDEMEDRIEKLTGTVEGMGKKIMFLESRGPQTARTSRA